MAKQITIGEQSRGVNKYENHYFFFYSVPLSHHHRSGVQAQPQPDRNNTRQVGNMLQRLEQSSSRFRNSLNVALVQSSVDQTQPQNEAH